MWNSFAAFVSSIPQLIKLFNTINKHVVKAKKDIKVKDTIKKIDKAWSENNENDLNNIINS